MNIITFLLMINLYLIAKQKYQIKIVKNVYKTKSKNLLKQIVVALYVQIVLLTYVLRSNSKIVQYAKKKTGLNNINEFII